jgi:hypothetical protein
MIRRSVFFAAALLSPGWNGSAQEPPAVPFSVSAENAYEGATLPREWRWCKPAIVRSEPSGSAPVVATIPAGQPAQAVDGRIRITRLGIVVVRDSLREEPTDWYRGPPLAPGDTVYLLYYLDELGWQWWYRGTEYESLDFWSTDPRDPVKALLVRAPGREDWLELRTPDGVTGWWRSERGPCP